MTQFIGLLLAPFMLSLMLITIRPGVLWIDRTMPECRVKRVLFFSWKN